MEEEMRGPGGNDSGVKQKNQESEDKVGSNEFTPQQRGGELKGRGSTQKGLNESSVGRNGETGDKEKELHPCQLSWEPKTR